VFQPARIFKATTCFYTQNTADARFVAKNFQTTLRCAPLNQSDSFNVSPPSQRRRSTATLSRLGNMRVAHSSSNFIDEARIYAN
jgi:hypothetical protein